jgi:hypothetical protein
LLYTVIGVYTHMTEFISHPWPADFCTREQD